MEEVKSYPRTLAWIPGLLTGMAGCLLGSGILGYTVKFILKSPSQYAADTIPFFLCGIILLAGGGVLLIFNTCVLVCRELIVFPNGLAFNFYPGTTISLQWSEVVRVRRYGGASGVIELALRPGITIQPRWVRIVIRILRGMMQMNRPPGLPLSIYEGWHDGSLEQKITEHIARARLDAKALRHGEAGARRR